MGGTPPNTGVQATGLREIQLADLLACVLCAQASVDGAAAHARRHVTEIRRSINA